MSATLLIGPTFVGAASVINDGKMFRFVLAGLCIATVSATFAERLPNVVLILADDMAVGDLSTVYSPGAHPTAETPNLNRLSRQSVCFDRAYSGSCVCAPARAALLTGRYPHRTGVVTLNMNRYPVMTRLKRDEITIADRLKEAGYVTGMIGKWHVGHGAAYSPQARGFDQFEGFSGSSETGYFDYQLEIAGLSEPLEAELATAKEDYLTDDLSRRAIEFVRRHQDHPFFLHLAHYAPHRPLEAPKTLVKKYQDRGFDESIATIYAMIEVMDRGVGELMNELESLGLADHTLVIFASDNGPDPLTGDRFNGPLRGRKYMVNEGGIRVPLMIRFPDAFEPGRRRQVVHFVDLVPTILDLCQVAPPSEPPSKDQPKMDGHSFAEVLKDADAVFDHPLYWQWNRGIPNYTHNASVRQGDYKLVRPFITRGIRVEDSELPARLYDLSSDPVERIDLASTHPEVASELEQKLDRWSHSVEEDRQREVAAED